MTINPLKNLPKSLISCLILFAFIHQSQAQSPTDTIIQLNKLEGKWYIHYSNFPMWLKGDKISPSFNYGLPENQNGDYLTDEVTYLKNGRLQSIRGIDKAVNPNKTRFVWRGLGLMRLLKSNWSIQYMDPQYQWALIQFDKTLFTPAGYDVIARAQEPDDQEVAKMLKMLQDSGLEGQLTRIKQ